MSKKNKSKKNEEPVKKAGNREHDPQFDAFKQSLNALRKEEGDKEKKDFDNLRAELPNFKTRLFSCYKCQIWCLKEHGCINNTNGGYENILRNITYYRLKGYMLKPDSEKPDNKKRDNRYIPFETACQIHEFDARMRALLSYAASKVELYLRSQFSYVYCDWYGKDAYAHLKAENYENRDGYLKTLKTIQKAVKQNKPTPFVRHYLENSGGLMPLWVMTELLDFGGLATFYKNWKEDVSENLLQALYGKGDRYRSAKKKNDNGTMRFISWLESCHYLRNVCAHGGRLYNRKFSQLPNFPDEFDEQGKNVAYYRMQERTKLRRGNTDFLWGAVLALQFLYPNQDEWNGQIVPQIKSLLDEFLPEIEHSRLRAAIGFPDDWEYWLRFWRTMS